MIDKAKDIFKWARKVPIVPELISIVSCEGIEVELCYRGWGHPFRNKGFYNDENPDVGYWSRLFLVEKDRTFLYLVGYKYMSPLKIIHISNPEELSKFTEDYVSKLHSHCVGDGFMDKTSFGCESCDKVALSIQYNGNSNRLVMDTIGVSRREARVPTYAKAGIKAAIKQKDARLLYSIDIEYVRNYCEVCDELYCAEHWKIMPIMNDDWCDGFVWICSRGHRKEF